VKRKELAQFSFPNRSLSYQKIAQGGKKELAQFSFPNHSLSFDHLTSSE